MEFEIRTNRSSAQGRMPLRNERAEYLQLMKQGLSNNETCRIVGINPKTGRRWRNGRNASEVRAAAPPIDSVVPLADPSRYLVASDRVHIADRLRENATVRTIASELGRSPSTISREIRRNRHPTSGCYRPYAAQTRADARKPRPKIGKITANPELWQFIQERLGLRWSPEQICQTLRRQFRTRTRCR